MWSHLCPGNEVAIGCAVVKNAPTSHAFSAGIKCCQCTWCIDVLGLLFKHVIHWCIYNRALADVRSTVAGIRCMYCKITDRSISPSA